MEFTIAVFMVLGDVMAGVEMPELAYKLAMERMLQ
jgi:hypothetical protein